MNAKIDIIHHAGLITADLDGVIAQYERLGFVFTPLSLIKVTLTPGEDPVYIGLGNRNAIFEKNYLEVVGIPDPEIWANFPVEKRGPFNIDERLPLYAGLHIMHFGSDDVEALRQDYLTQGQPISDIARLQRMVQTPEGQRLMQAKAISYPRAANPEGLIQVAQHVTPEYVLQPRYIGHANGARRMTEVIVCSDAPEQLAAKYSSYSGHTVSRRDGLLFVDLGNTRVLVVDPDGLDHLVPGYKPPSTSFLAGFTVATPDLEQARELLIERRIDCAEVNGRIVVSPTDACGSAVLFEELDATR